MLVLSKEEIEKLWFEFLYLSSSGMAVLFIKKG